MTGKTGTKARTATPRTCSSPSPAPPPGAEGDRMSAALPADLDESLTRLKMPHARRVAPELLATAKAESWSHEEMLRRVLAE